MSLSPEVLSATIKSVQTLLECPNCLKIPKSPCFKQCSYGHVLCQECSQNLLRCSDGNCKDKFINKEPLIYRKLLEVLPRWCENKDCNAVITSRNDHIELCIFGSTTCLICPEYSCMRHELLEHLYTTHSQSIVSDNYIEYTVTSFTGDVNQDIKSLESFPFVTPFHVFGNLFWFTLKHSDIENSLTFKSFITPLGSTIKDSFQCKIEILGENGSSLIYSKLMNKMEAKFTIENSTLCKCSEKQNLKFRITISKSEDLKLNNSVYQTQNAVPSQMTLDSRRRKSQSNEESGSTRKKSRSTNLRSEKEIRLTVEEMQQVMQDIFQLMKCPFCLSLPTLEGGAPQQCLKGHVVCNPCRNTLQNCPSCKGNFIKKIPSVFCKVLSVLPKP